MNDFAFDFKDSMKPYGILSLCDLKVLVYMIHMLSLLMHNILHIYILEVENTNLCSPAMAEIDSLRLRRVTIVTHTCFVHKIISKINA